MDNKIHSIALFGSDQTLLYARNFYSGSVPTSASASPPPAAPEAQLKTQFLAHTALDVVAQRTSSKQVEQYLGLLFTQEDVAVYGWQSCTKVKVLVMVLLSEHVVRDLDMITIFRAIYHRYLTYISNPFNDLPTQLAHLPSVEASRPVTARPIRSKTFDRQMELVAGLY